METRIGRVGKEGNQLSDQKQNVQFLDNALPEEVLEEVNSLLKAHGIKIQNSYQGGLCGLEGTYTCWVEKDSE